MKFCVTYVIGSSSLVGIRCENFSEKLLELLVSFEGSEFSCGNFTVQVGLKLREEWKLTSQKYVQNNAACPDVSRKARIWLLSNDVRAHVVWCSAVAVKLLLRLRVKREPKIDYLDLLSRRVNQDIVQLQVSMHCALRMHIPDSQHQLPEHNLAIVDWHLLVWQFLCVMEQAGTLAQLGH